MESTDMTATFSISCEWSSPQAGPPEIGETSALVEVKLGDRFATRADNDFSGSVTNRPPLAAYPLAMWLAASWWRLRWESVPANSANVEWRMSHEMAAIGSGFVWPSISFESDGENIEVAVRPSVPSTLEPLHYLEHYDELVSARDFERAVDHFVDRVCARLDDRGISDTPLHQLWSELNAERRTPNVTSFRQIEAILGFDPGEARSPVVEQFLFLQNDIGSPAAREIAYASAGVAPGQVLQQILQAVKHSDLAGGIDLPSGLRTAIDEKHTGRLLPVQRGRRLARELRALAGLDGNPLSDSDLGDFLELPEAVFKTVGPNQTRLPISLAIRSPDEEYMAFYFRKKHHFARRFEAARILGDSLTASTEDSWLPATDAATARQKVQRAFAAEFLCPIDMLIDFLKGDFSEESILDAGDRFGISELAIRSHLVNNHVPGSEHIVL